MVREVATHLGHSAAHDKNFYFEKPKLMIFRIKSKYFNARILPHLPGTEDSRDPFCKQSPQIVNFVGINLNFVGSSNKNIYQQLNALNPELNPICYLLALLGAHHFLHVSRIRVKLLTFRRLMSYIYIWSTYS